MVPIEGTLHKASTAVADLKWLDPTRSAHKAGRLIYVLLVPILSLIHI